ncbi:MAG: DNA repair exonuclease [Firmicutes bacterium]|nr:DNA repair exonuclease [Bacillota bacterium]
MRCIKFLHCADIHLDTPFVSLGIEENSLISKSTLRRMDLKNTFQDIIKIARDKEVEFIFISGDLYEHNYVRKSTINFINNVFKSISNIKVFIVPGNHDPWVKGSYYENFEWAENVHILTKDNNYVYLEEEGICIYGPDAFPGIFISENHSKNNIKDNNIKEYINPDNINILLAHGTLDLNIGGNSYNLMSSRQLASLGMDYIAMGHFHKRMDNIGSNEIIFNPGSPEPLGFDEPGEHGVYVGSIVKKGIQDRQINIDFIVTNKKRYEVLRVDISGCVTDEQITAKITDAIAGIPNISTYITSPDDMASINMEFLNMPSLLLSIVLYGYIDPQYKVDTEYIFSCFKDKVFYIKVKNEAVPDYDFEEIKKETGLKGLFTKKLLELIEKTQDTYEKELLIKSLYYGIQAIEKGQVDVIW